MASIINAATSGGLITTADTSGNLQLQTAGTTALTVTSAQIVGIGTSSPANKLTVADNSASAMFYGTQSGAGDLFAVANSASEKFRISNAGTVQTFSTVSVGNATPSSSGAGITFPATQSASSDANTLDDYEEGTWSPAITPGSGSLTTHTSSGTYTKIGRTVHITFKSVITTPGNASGDMYITGFPFTNGNGYQTPTLCREMTNVGTAYQAFINQNATTGYVRTLTEGGISWTTNNQYVFFMTYIV
jgi:hypothetical protein